MRSAFGRFALELRVARGITQTEFSAQIGLSLSRISNIEHSRVAVSTDVANAYISTLRCNGEEADKLMKLSYVSNTKRRLDGDGKSHSPLLAMFNEFSDQLSPKALAEIQSILERETGESVSSLTFASNRTPATRRQKPGSIKVRPGMLPARFVEICMKAHNVRQRVAGDLERLRIGLVLERLCALDERFDYDVVEGLPAVAEGAFACIVGEETGVTILLEERRFESACKGVHFAVHCIAHEIAHHFLHQHLLASDGRLFLAPQALAANTPEMIGGGRQIEQVVDTIEEVEAECFATMLIIPWEAFIKGTAVKYLSDDYGEQLGEVKRYQPYFKNPAVVESIKKSLWEKGLRTHTIFSLG